MASTRGYQRPDPASIMFAGTVTHRDSTEGKDFRLVNMLAEPLENKLSEEKKPYILKREGTTQYSYPPAVAAVGRGVYYWSETGKVYSVFADKLYANGTSIQTLNTSTGRVGFSENQGGTKYLMVDDGTDAWLVNTSDTVVQVTDGQFPTPTTTYTENVDGYTLVVDSATGAVYNSDLDDPTSWTSEFITAEIYPDLGQAIARYRNMFILFGRESSEFFYNAGNTTGSPFSRAQQYSQEIGIAEPATLSRTNDKVFFVGQNTSGNRAVYTIEEEKFKIISPEPYNRILNDEGTDISNADGFVCNFQGHPCYVLNLNTADRTLVYDMITEMWWEIENTSGAKWDYLYATKIDGGRTLIQHRTNGKIYTVTTTTYQDDASNYTASVTTNLLDFGTQKRKFGTRLDLFGDRHSSTNSLSISWSDDDYQNFSTARTVDLAEHMFLRNLGSFRRRAFKISHTDNSALRLERMELEFDLGEY